MSWAIGYDSHWGRDIGYGVPAECDQPECEEKIDRGLAYVCGGQPYGGEDGCGLDFCDGHLYHRQRDDATLGPQLCEYCQAGEVTPFAAKPDLQEWTDHKATDPSWAEWRAEQAQRAAAAR